MKTYSVHADHISESGKALDKAEFDAMVIDGFLDGAKFYIYEHEFEGVTTTYMVRYCLVDDPDFDAVANETILCVYVIEENE